MRDIAALAARIMRAIDHDIAAGLVPAGVASFAELHDHVDANEYLIEQGLGTSDRDNTAAGAACDIVAGRLAARSAEFAAGFERGTIDRGFEREGWHAHLAGYRLAYPASCDAAGR